MRSPQVPEAPDWLTVAQVAEMLHISVRAVHYRITKGQLTATKVGVGGTAPYVIARSEVERLKADAA